MFVSLARCDKRILSKQTLCRSNFRRAETSRTGRFLPDRIRSGSSVGRDADGVNAQNNSITASSADEPGFPSTFTTSRGFSLISLYQKKKKTTFDDLLANVGHAEAPRSRRHHGKETEMWFTIGRIGTRCRSCSDTRETKGHSQNDRKCRNSCDHLLRERIRLRHMKKFEVCPQIH